jgi:ribosomal protein L37AE/L43A
MANPVQQEADVSAGTYQCTNCGNEIVMRSQTHIPPCPQCHDTVSGRRSAAETAS